MNESPLEKRIVQMLTCEPNLPILKSLILEQCGFGFEYLTSELPVLTDNGYGFVDLVGKARNGEVLAFLECKRSRASLPIAESQARVYEEGLSEFGVIQRENLIGLYHRVLGDVTAQKQPSFEVCPLILDRDSLIQHSSQPLRATLAAYREHMLGWVCDKYGLAEADVQDRIAPDSIPIYVVDVLDRNERKSVIGHLGLSEPLRFSDLGCRVEGAPLRVKPEESNFGVLQRVRKLKEPNNRFSVQFPRHGHSRPMVFIEIDEEFSICMLHTGEHVFEVNGYYETKRILGSHERIYGLAEVETGRCNIATARGSRITVRLTGNTCKGILTMDFLDRIYVDDSIRLLEGRQESLEGVR